MAVGDHFRAAVVGNLASQEIVSVFHFRQSSANASGVSDVQSLAEAISDKYFITGDWQDPLSEDIEWTRIEARTFPLPGTPPVGHDKAILMQGSIALPALPPASAVVIRRRTAFLGRAYRGRIFLAGLAKDNAVAGQVSGAPVIAALNTLATTFATQVIAAAAGSPAFVPEICAIIPNPAVPGTFVYRATDITSCVLDKVIRSQRRREIGVGA